MTDQTLDYAAALRRFGTANPENVENPLWLDAMSENLTAWRLRQRLGCDGASETFWSWQRCGRTSTVLPDGRIVHVAGEHEDYYDPDFCIYNDVAVEHPDGRFDFYLYPRDVFPPTDFHSATLIGDWIYLIGSLGYGDARGERIQVMRLDTRDFHIERVETAGEVPGWLSRHCAERLDDTRILVAGGNYASKDGLSPNRELFELDAASRQWRRRAHGDAAIFPVPREIYDAGKSPRVGRANPEKVDNPYWLEMAKRRWLPSRARLHYGDFASEAASPTREEADALPLDAMFARKTSDGPKVWSARRAEAASVTLDDGREVQICGVIRDYEEGFEEEWADPFTYADVIVAHPGGEIEIYIYPREILPPLWPFCAVARPGCIFIFGDIDRAAGREHSGPIVLRLDARSFEITVIDEGGAPPRANFYPESLRIDGDLALFELARDSGDQPLRWAVFDLVAMCWRD